MKNEVIKEELQNINLNIKLTDYEHFERMFTTSLTSWKYKPIEAWVCRILKVYREHFTYFVM